MTTPITIEEFRARFPEFDNPVASDAQVQAAIEDTTCNFDINKWGCHYKRGHSLYVAHFLTIDKRRRSGKSGSSAPALQANSKGADGLSVGYNSSASSSNSEEYFKSTNYGQEFLTLLESVKVPGATLICG